MSTDVRGRIAIDVQFWDRTSAEGLQSLKTIALQDSTEYTTGKVAVVSGTAGTAGVGISVAPSVYKNASGDAVSFSSVSRVVLYSIGSCFVDEDVSSVRLVINGSGAAMSDTEAGGTGFQVQTTAGTASYTLVLYGT